MKSEQLRLAILISGRGSTAAAVIKECENGSLQGKVEPVIVVASNSQAGEEIRKLENHPRIIKEELSKVFDEHNPDLVAQLGWLPKTPEDVIENLRNRGGKIFNQHPGNPHKFGGVYGKQVLCAFIVHTLLTRGESVTMAATHYVTEEIDGGKLIRIKPYRLKFFNPKHLSDDKAIINLTIREQGGLIKIEHQNVIETLKLFCDGEKPQGFRFTDPAEIENDENLKQAKIKARQLFPRG